MGSGRHIMPSSEQQPLEEVFPKRDKQLVKRQLEARTHRQSARKQTDSWAKRRSNWSSAHFTPFHSVSLVGCLFGSISLHLIPLYYLSRRWPSSTSSCSTPLHSISLHSYIQGYFIDFVRLQGFWLLVSGNVICFNAKKKSVPRTSSGWETIRSFFWGELGLFSEVLAVS